MASGDTLYTWLAVEAKPPSSNQAELIERNDHNAIEYDAALTEFMLFPGVMPTHYGGNGVSARVRWLSESAITGEIRIDGEFERLDDDGQDLDSTNFATPQSKTMTPASGSGELDYDAIAFTNGAQMASVAAGEDFRFRLSRDHDHADDDMAGGAQVRSLILVEA